MASSRYPHVISLPENSLGEDVSIGDVHGAIKPLKQLLSQLGEHDRLFIVGDLIDKGSNSKAVVDLVYQHRPGGLLKPTIYVTQGNHEVAFNEFAHDLSDGKNSKRHDWWLNHPQSGAAWIRDLSNDQVNQIYEYTGKLPFIIKVKGKNPFYVAHAGLPASIRNDELNANEQFFVTEAREYGNPNVFHKRSIFSPLLVSGHDIILYDTQRAVRERDNAINLDVHAFHTDCLVAIFHRARRAVIIGDPSPEVKQALNIIVTSINNRLNSKYVSMFMSLQQVIAIAERCKQETDGLKYLAQNKNNIIFFIDLLLRNIDLLPPTDPHKIDLINMTLEPCLDIKACLSKFCQASLSFFTANKSFLQKMQMVEDKLTSTRMELSVLATLSGLKKA